MKEECRTGCGDEEKYGRNKVGQRKGKSLEELPVTEKVRILRCRVSEETTETRTYNAS